MVPLLPGLSTCRWDEQITGVICRWLINMQVLMNMGVLYTEMFLVSNNMNNSTMRKSLLIGASIGVIWRKKRKRKNRWRKRNWSTPTGVENLDVIDLHLRKQQRKEPEKPLYQG